jgi:hypothetical protein
MTDTEKLANIKTMIGISDTSQDALIGTYLSMAAQEIIQFKYSLVGADAVTEVDAEDEITQIFAVVAGYNMRGAENQTSHNENQIYRTFHYTDMMEYIHNHVIPYARV